MRNNFRCDWCCRDNLTKCRDAIRPKDGRRFALCEEYCWDIPEILWGATLESKEKDHE